MHNDAAATPAPPRKRGRPVQNESDSPRKDIIAQSFADLEVRFILRTGDR